MTPRAWLYFAVVAFLWGVPYFFIKVALHDLSPSMIAFLRVTIGALTLLPVAIGAGALAPLRDRIPLLVVLAVIEISLPFSFIARGEQYISSSLTGILIASEPLFIAILASRVDASERVTGARLVGLLVGLMGVVALLGLGGMSRSALGGAAMILFATFDYSVGALLIKHRFSDVPSVGVVASALSVSALVLAAPAIATAPHVFPSTGTVISLMVLGVACTGLAFLAFFALIAMAGAGRASIITYVAPAIALLLGVAARGEVFTGITALGLLLILAGSWLGTTMRSATEVPSEG